MNYLVTLEKPNMFFTKPRVNGYYLSVLFDGFYWNGNGMKFYISCVDILTNVKSRRSI